MASNMQSKAWQATRSPRQAASRSMQLFRRVMIPVTCQAPVGTATAAPPASTREKPLLQRHQRLRDPARIGAEGSSTVNVRDMSHTVMNSNGVQEDISLDAYMRLPVEQYYILDPSQIQFLSGNTFVLSVPKINLLTATLQPVIQVQVTSEPDAVVLQAIDCQLNATGILDDLDSKFAMQFTTRLTWNSQAHNHMAQPQQQHQSQHAEQRQQAHQHESPQASQESSSNVNSNGLSAATNQLRSGWNKLRSSISGSSNIGAGPSQADTTAAGQPSSTPGSITGTGQVQVWCEVVPPFHLMPKDVLERSCNVVISGLVNSLLPWFMRQLAADYQKWAADEQYRNTRRQRTVVKQQQQQQLQLQQQQSLH